MTYYFTESESDFLESEEESDSRKKFDEVNFDYPILEPATAIVKFSRLK